MLKDIRILPLITPIIILFLLECFVIFPSFFYISLVFINLIILHTVVQLTKQSEIQESWYNFFIFPSFMATSSAVYSIMLTNTWIMQGIFVFIIISIYLYFRQSYYYLILPKKYKENALENFSSYGNFLIMFFTFSSVYGLQSFLNMPIYLLILFLIPIILIISYQVIWSNQINVQRGVVFILINTLILVELAWTASFLPQSYSTIGLIMAICYYIVTGIVRFSLKENLEGIKNKSKQYISFGIICIIIILLTSEWI